MPPSPDDASTTLNEVLSEVIDLVLEVKQAHRKVPETHALHAELDHLAEDMRAWAQLLVARDEAVGLSPLARIPSVAGRKPPNLWPGAATDEEVRQFVDGHLDLLALHVTAAMAAQDDDDSRAALADIERGVIAHRTKLGELD